MITAIRSMAGDNPVASHTVPESDAHFHEDLHQRSKDKPQMYWPDVQMHPQKNRYWFAERLCSYADEV